ncbi:MAG: hypothetical protein KatS3mg114_0405 [Planctomycetaceae bacterium]|nr:MAG: hypothetical protein KatS3mg114_0405 [Planctomycetaceae bacterium]
MSSPASSKPHAHHHSSLELFGLLAGTVACAVLGLTAWLWELYVPTNSTSPPTTVVILYGLAYLAGGWHTAVHAAQELLSGRLNIDILMLAAALGAAALGHYAEGVVLLFLFALSQLLETLILGRTRRAITELMHLSPETAVRLTPNGEEHVPVEKLRAGDVVLVHPGERLPADGLILQGESSIDQSPLTGESLPVDKQPGDEVFAGTLNQQGVLQLKVLRPAQESTLARTVQLVEEAQSQRARSQQFTEWFGEHYTYVVLGLSLATFWLFLLTGGESWSIALYRAMTVLVVASPCAVVISIPAAILTAISRAAQGGVLVKGGAVLETCAALRALALDKTGTLTLGKPRVVAIIPAAGLSADEVLRYAASLEILSEHPLARAIVQETTDRGLGIPEAQAVQAITGQGIQGHVAEHPIRVGKPRWFAEMNWYRDPVLQEHLQQFHQRGETAIVVADEQRWWGVLAVADSLRPTAAESLQLLRQLGLQELWLLTGDSERVARNLAERLQVSYRAELLPPEKVEAVRSLKQRWHVVGMMGDGINDAPALAAADVGISLGGAGTDVALETADVVILADDLRRLPFLISLSRATQTIIRQNLMLALGIMGILLISTYVGHLPLPLAVVGHEGSTLLVILNGLRLLRFPQQRLAQSASGVVSTPAPACCSAR